MEYERKLCPKCSCNNATFDYQPVRINYDYWIDWFDQGWLVPTQLPSNADEVCEDTVDPQDCN